MVKGDWRHFEAAAFAEWDVDRHVVDSFQVPQDWAVIRAMDWGFKSPYAVLWLAQNPESGEIYVVDELYGFRRGQGGAILGPEHTPDDVRGRIEDHESVATDDGSYPPPRIGPADPSMWRSNGGETSQGDLINLRERLFVPANRDRLLGWQLLHQLLHEDAETQEPRLRVFRSCKHLIRTLPLLECDPKQGEDVRKGGEDHLAETLRYGLVALLHGVRKAIRPRQDMKRLEALAKRPVFI